MQSLTTTESARLKELESLIDSNVSLVGKALFEIRESKLYKQTHGTFEDYCQERFTMSRNYINKQIKAAETVGNLETIGFQTVGNLGTIVPKPSSEAQARPLSKLPAAQQPAAWEKAQEAAKEEGKPVAARHVEKAVAEVIDALVVDGTKGPEKKTIVRKLVLSMGMGIFRNAKSVMSTITKTDTERESAFKSMIEYCKQQLGNK